MPDYTAFSPLYDWSLLEKGVQDYFVSTGGFVAPPGESDSTRESWLPDAGVVPFFTAFEALLFQKARPRVACFLNGINNATTPGHMIEDINGALRNVLWRGNLILEIATEANYTAHCALRSKVQALAEMMAPMVRDATQPVGVNPFLTYHQINYVLPSNINTAVTPDEGFYGSQLSYQITFSVPPAVLAAVAD